MSVTGIEMKTPQFRPTTLEYGIKQARVIIMQKKSRKSLFFSITTRVLLWTRILLFSQDCLLLLDRHIIIIYFCINLYLL
jgi:hypothetical protein